MDDNLLSRLSPEHLQMLHQSAISDTVIATRGYRTVTNPVELEQLGFSQAQCRPGLLLPLHTTDGGNGLYVLRPDNPRVVEEKHKGKNRDGTYPCKVIKYEYPRGAPMRVDCPPTCQSQLANPRVRLWLTEGQKKADALASLGECAVALLGVWNWKGKNAHGGTTFLSDFDYIAFDNRDVRIVFDSDIAVKPQVRHAMDRLRYHLQNRKANVSVVYLPASPGGAKWGVDDFFTAGNTLDDLLALSEKPRDTSETVGKSSPSQATLLIQYGLRAELFHSAEGRAYASVRIGNHVETLPVRSQKFKQWLAYSLYGDKGDASSASSMQDALTVLEARAVFDGAEQPVFVRFGNLDDSVWLDLADNQYRAIQITPQGWTIVTEAQVRFRRMSGMLPIPLPVRGGRFDELRNLINIGGDEDWMMTSSWLVAAIRARGPYPIGVVDGEQGAAKSTYCRILRSLIDPNVAPLRAEPRELRDLIIAANNGGTIALDNISMLPDWLSDALCRLATGGGFATRRLYTDDEEILFEVQRPILLNGIGTIVTRGDLLDRSLILHLPGLAEEKRIPEKEFWATFEQARPRILGALLDILVAALREYSQVKLSRLPRMADFAKFSVAAAPAFGWSGSDFLRVYGGKRNDVYELTLESASITEPLQTVLQNGAWNGTAAELLARLNSLTDEKTQRRADYPKSPLALANLLRRLAPAFRNTGTSLEFDRKTHGRRVIEIQGSGFLASPASPIHNPMENPALLPAEPTKQVTLGDADAVRGDAGVTPSEVIIVRQKRSGDASDAEILAPLSREGAVI